MPARRLRSSHRIRIDEFAFDDANNVIEHLSLAEWTAFDERFPAPTAFARPYWVLALTQTYPHLIADPVRIAQPGKAPLVVALVRERGAKLPWRIWHGSLYGAYTCFLHEDGKCADAAETARAIEVLMRESDACDITPWPLAFDATRLIFSPRVNLRQVEQETAVLDLRTKDDPANLGTRTSRAAARQAQRLGVICKVDRSPSATNTYYKMLEESAHRWGIARPTIPRRLLEACVELGGENVELRLAKISGEAVPVAGCVVLYGASEVFGWTMTMRAGFERLRPSNALNLDVLGKAVERGMHWYNLGGSAGRPGIAKFKERLGANRVAYHRLIHEHGSLKMAKRLSSSLNAALRHVKPSSS